MGLLSACPRKSETSWADMPKNDEASRGEEIVTTTNSRANSLFFQLRDANRAGWKAYVDHPFLRQLAQGNLPGSAFRHYLGQDYLFLVHFARAYGLAI